MGSLQQSLQLTPRLTLPSSTVDTILLFPMDLVPMEATMEPMPLMSLVAREDLLSQQLTPRLTLPSSTVDTTLLFHMDLLPWRLLWAWCLLWRLCPLLLWQVTEMPNVLSL